MNDHDGADRKHENPDHWHPDHWDMFAEAMDLTIEGHRLIAQEIVFETKLLWRGAVAWARDLRGATARGRSSPPL
jgi:hypothetical protein